MNFETERIVVIAPKTEYLVGKESRVIPLFPELVERFLILAVISWLGNSPYITLKSYLQTTEVHFEDALKTDQKRRKIQRSQRL